MKVVPFAPQYERQIIELWNRNVASQFPMTPALFQQNTLLDANVLAEGSAVMELNGQVCGVVISKVTKCTKGVEMATNKGWIHLLLVDAPYRKQGIGTLLLQHAEQALKAAGMEKIQFGGDLLHYLCGVPKEDVETQTFLQHKGYVYEAVMTDLTQTLMEPVALPTFEEIHFEPLKFQEKEAFLQFMHRVFPGRWEYEAIVYFEQGGTGKEFVVAKKGEQIIGFCRMNDDSGPTIAQNMNWAPALTGKAGGIGPLGIEEAERKGGYGLGITQAAMHFLQQRHVETILIDWTTLITFYEKLGFSPWQHYCTYGKTF